MKGGGGWWGGGRFGAPSSTTLNATPSTLAAKSQIKTPPEARNPSIPGPQSKACTWSTEPKPLQPLEVEGSGVRVRVY